MVRVYFAFAGRVLMTIKVANIGELRAIEKAADRAGHSYERMMIDAGRAASAFLQSRLTICKSSIIVFLLGKGNNGGDGLTMALDLASKTSADIRLYMVGMRGERDTHFRAAVDAGIVYAVAHDDAEGRILANWIGEASAIIDALIWHWTAAAIAGTRRSSDGTSLGAPGCRRDRRRRKRIRARE